MLVSSSLCFTDFTPLSVRLTTSGCAFDVGAVWAAAGAGGMAAGGVDEAACAKSSAGTSAKLTADIRRRNREEGRGKREEGLRKKASVARPSSRFPLPSSLQAFQQRVVTRRCCDALDEPFHSGTGRHLLETASEGVDMLYLIWTEELVFTTRAAGRDIDGRENSFLRERAIQLDFAVTGALEFLEDDVVHARSGLDEGSRDDGERPAAVLRSDRASGAEESFRSGHRRRIETTRQRPSGATINGRCP